MITISLIVLAALITYWAKFDRHPLFRVRELNSFVALFGAAFLFGLALLADFNTASAQDSLNVRLMGRFTSDAFRPYAYDIEIIDTVAVLATGSSGFRIVTITDTTNFQEIAYIPTDEVAIAIEVEGNVGYGAIKECGLPGCTHSTPKGRVKIFNLESRHEPQEISTIDSLNELYDIEVEGDYLYVADGASGLRIYNVADPENALEIGSLATADAATSLLLFGNTLYLAEGHGIKIVDVSNPENPVEIGYASVNVNSTITSFERSGDFLFVATREFGVDIFDVADSSFPVHIASYEDTLNGAFNLRIEGDFLYVASGSGGIVRLGIADPHFPELSGGWNSPGFTHDVAVIGDIVHLADGHGGVRSCWIQNVNTWSPIGSYNSTINSVSVVGSMAYLGTGTNGLTAVDVSDPLAPNPVIAYDDPSIWQDYWGVQAIAGSRFIYVCDAAGEFRVIGADDIQNPTTLGLVGSTPTNSPPFDIARNGDVVHAINTGGEMQSVINFQGAIPQPFSPHWGSSAANGVAVDGNYAYVTHNLGLDIVNVTNLAQPSGMTVMIPNGGWGVAVSNGYAYVGSADFSGSGNGLGLTVVNVQNPANPFVESFTWAGENLTSIAISGNYAFAAAGTQGLKAFDISNPIAPVEVGHYNPTSGWAYDVDVEGNHVYLADGVSLSIYDISTILDATEHSAPAPAQYVLNDAYPNPFNPSTTIEFSLSKPANVRLTVMNILGAHVATLANGYMQSGTHHVNFSAADLSTGTYFYRLQAGAFSETKKLTLLK